MRLGFDLALQQTQKLVMTPELRQAIKLLQFNSNELREYLETQMESNPLIEMEIKNNKENVDIDKVSDKVDNDIDWKEYISQYDDISYKNNISKSKEYNYENFITKEESLKNHLLFQIDLTFFNPKDKFIGIQIVENIDSNGYLSSTIEDISSEIGVKEENVKNVLEIIQTFDPVGVGARDLKECLTIQLRDKNFDNLDILTVIDNHLEDVGNNRLNKIAKDLDVSIKRVQSICDIIKTLEPKPGRGFPSDNDDIRYVTPDVVLEKIDGEYVIMVNDITAPRLTINNFYKNMLNNEGDNDISKFINNKLNSAMWLIKSIEQRRMTIYKVVSSIVQFQHDFFEKGQKSLKPLTLKEIADDIEMHESTVSRATNGKYVQTPRGIFELKYFFSSGIGTEDGGVASTGIKSMIKDLIEKEHVKKPLSDQKIADILKEKDIKISRRTVAKYRDELKIPSSSKRRRY
ncbi:RNA polymerase factor sigma-54 [Clostridium sp. D2Q-11]|uniref:RNA polymerase factor sigma-54 n=1 Tax=Anaeromonas frigoriresistens TaxID=2683708 RepID=A0A942Z6N6_9FIRM|nr:RNA polymerase factor sigma-54 [Anaeromonas frigoriresistens]MBS4537772.1 RNA polymerase factor sigma-54 [Anaeromonas frigoriresistens]